APWRAPGPGRRCAAGRGRRVRHGGRGPRRGGARPRRTAWRRETVRASPAARRWRRTRSARARLGGEGVQRDVELALRIGDGNVGGDPRALLDPAASQVASVGREVLPDRDVERAAVGHLLDLLEDALAEGAG